MTNKDGGSSARPSGSSDKENDRHQHHHRHRHRHHHHHHHHHPQRHRQRRHSQHRQPDMYTSLWKLYEGGAHGGGERILSELGQYARDNGRLSDIAACQRHVEQFLASVSEHLANDFEVLWNALLTYCVHERDDDDNAGADGNDSEDQDIEELEKEDEAEERQLKRMLHDMRECNVQADVLQQVERKVADYTQTTDALLKHSIDNRTDVHKQMEELGRSLQEATESLSQCLVAVEQVCPHQDWVASLPNHNKSDPLRQRPNDAALRTAGVFVSEGGGDGGVADEEAELRWTLEESLSKITK